MNTVAMSFAQAVAPQRHLVHAAQDLSDRLADSACYLRPLLAALRVADREFAFSGRNSSRRAELDAIVRRGRLLIGSLQRVVELAEASAPNLTGAELKRA